MIAGSIVALLTLALGRLDHRSSTPTAANPTARPGRGLDVAGFRARLAERRATVHELQRRRASARPASPPSAPVSPDGAAHRGYLAGIMLTPRCILGPADLCAALADSVDACDDGDGAACLAVGQYLQDEPPRPLIALAFFVYACKRGDQAGCDRVVALKAPAASPPAPCADDPLACGLQAMRSKDDGQLDFACAAGVADACAWMIEHSAARPERARAYLELACQLGSPMACSELGRRLSADCTEDCYPPDPAGALAASTIACDVGFDDACARGPSP